MNRAIKIRQLRTPGQVGAELENQFILRLGKRQADQIREAIRQGQTNVKDRMGIQLDFTNDKDDMRNGVITVDTIMYKARLLDLPTIMETWKTIDGKNFYKTADVYQILTIREGEDPPEEEDPKKKRKDPNKVDKKYLLPHGYTPPLKNIRKRRFRKTLRKKNLDLPEIEKEVKRLLRTDNESVSIKWEVVREEDERKQNIEANLNPSNLDEQLFGGDVSSSDDEVGATINIIDEDEDSRMSAESNHFSESNIQNEAANSLPSKAGIPSVSGVSGPLVTEFNSSMFKGDVEPNATPPKPSTPSSCKTPRSKGKRSSSKSTSGSSAHKQTPPTPSQSSPDNINKLCNQLALLENEQQQLIKQRSLQQAEISTVKNLALKQKFLTKLSDLELMIREKETEIIEIQRQLDGMPN